LGVKNQRRVKVLRNLSLLKKKKRRRRKLRDKKLITLI